MLTLGFSLLIKVKFPQISKSLVRNYYRVFKTRATIICRAKSCTVRLWLRNFPRRSLYIPLHPACFLPCKWTFQFWTRVASSSQFLILSSEDECTTAELSPTATRKSVQLILTSDSRVYHSVSQPALLLRRFCDVILVSKWFHSTCWLIRYNLFVWFRILKIAPKQVAWVCGIQMNYIIITLSSKLFR